MNRIFPVWKIIKLGTGLKTADDFHTAIVDDGSMIHGSAIDMLRDPAFTAASEEIEVRLVDVSAAELGFEGPVKYTDICKRAKEFSLERCPPEVGVQLRLQHESRPDGEWHNVAMKPIEDMLKEKLVFTVGHDGVSPCLGVSDVSSDQLYDISYRWVFTPRE